MAGCYDFILNLPAKLWEDGSGYPALSLIKSASHSPLPNALIYWMVIRHSASSGWAVANAVMLPSDR